MKNNKGITLIALIITVILMLILVGVVVTNVHNRGIFNYAETAVTKTELASIIEDLEIEGVMKGKNNLNGKLSELLETDYSKYDNTFKVENGELIYSGNNPTIIAYLFELGQGEGSIENASAICAIKGHNYMEANYLNPKTCTRCGHTDGTILAATEPHPDQQNSEDIGIGTDGNLVNLDNWTYSFNQYNAKLTGYIGTYSEPGGEIDGKVPQVINGVDVISMPQTFLNATDLKVIPDIPNTVEEFFATFRSCSNLESIPETFSFKNAFTTEIMFMGCANLKQLPENAIFTRTNNFETSKGMFEGCSSLIKLPNNFKIPDGCQAMNNMFKDCISLEKLPTNFNIPETVNNVSYMFSKCTNLASLPEGITIPEGCSNLSSVFANCSSLEYLPDNFSIPSTATDMMNILSGCSSLKSLPEGFRIPDGVTSAQGLIWNCTNLVELPDNFIIPASVTNIISAFRSCPNLEGTIIILGNPTTYLAAFRDTATSGNGLTVKYTSACTNIESIKATVSSGANITFEEITL